MKLEKKQNLALGLAIGIAIVLALAAFGKIFFPPDSLQTLERAVACFEILFFLIILFLRNKWGMWLCAAVIFSGWMGYAFFWENVKLPCGCMGALIHIPPLYAILLDQLFFFLSLLMAYLLGAGKQWLFLGILCSFLSNLVGYAFAEWIYTTLLGG